MHRRRREGWCLSQFVEAADGWVNWKSAGPDDQLVIGEPLFRPAWLSHRDSPAEDIDRGGHRVQAQGQPGPFEVGDASVRKVAPVGHLAGDVVRDAADREVRVGVGDHDGDLGGRVELAGAQPRGDAGVASADGHQVHFARSFPASAIALPRGRAGPTLTGRELLSQD